MIDKDMKFENSYLDLPEIFYTIQNPSKVKEPRIIKFNSALAEELGMNLETLNSEEWVKIFSGNNVLEGSIPLAQAYSGHQFGHFNMLGDGRAILLGEYISKTGDRVDIQLKGSGWTPYSRGGDGKAALGPMLREYIISEAMNGLEIPTTRSLAVVSTGEKVIREKYLKGAILTRVASSHIRVGTFEFAARMTDFEDLKALADYTIKRHYEEGLKEDNPYLYLLKEVIKKQANLVAKWQLVGFIHGVMNTDNMLICGETIDYGPCAFMDTYAEDTVFSSIDHYGRYAYGNQPNMAGWNLARFAESLIPLLSENRDEAIKLAQEEINNFYKIYENAWLNGMRKKLGLFNEEVGDKELITSLLNIMENNNADFTNAFRGLTIGDIEVTGMGNKFKFTEWIKVWKERLARQQQNEEDVAKLMKKNNPVVIPRNHKVEEALEKANDGDYSYLENLLSKVSNPYDYTITDREYLNGPINSSKCYKTYCGT